MSITLLLAQCTSAHLQQSIRIIIKVLEELDVAVHKVDLMKLPYFNGNKTREMDMIIKSITEGSGVIAVTNVPMLSVHAAMQSFFDFATLYDEAVFNKPMMAVTYSEWLGEVEAAQRILKSWNVLGGIEGNKVCFNNQMPVSEIGERIEREVEDFYRLMKQERHNLGCSERQIYNFIKTGNTFEGYSNNFKSVSKEALREEIKAAKQPEIRSFAELLRQDNKQVVTKENEADSIEPIVSTKKKEERAHINISTKEQTIKEIAGLLEKEVKEEMTPAKAGVYARPQVKQMNGKRIHQLPHYFVAQHDKSLNMVLKYQITDTNDNGYIVITNGDCHYEENTDISPTIEIIMNQSVFEEVVDKKITYQKAFMLGKLKVKGNFAILPKIDQIFKTI